MGRCSARTCAAVLAAVLVTVLLPAGPARAALVGPISGVVTAAGEPVEHAWVSIIPVTPAGLWASQGVVTSTDAQGRYRVDDVYTDFVKVRARGPAGLATTYWPDASTFGDAKPVRITTAGARADVDLPRGGSVSGQVVDARTGEPVAGAQVTAQAASGGSWEQVGSAALVAGTQPGSFALADLPPVPVVLWVQAPPGSRYLGQWFDAAGYIGEARWLDGAATTSGLTVRLARGAELAGTVRDDRGSPVAGASVSVIGCPGLCPQVAVTDAQGRYRFAALVPGPARLQAEADAAGYLSQWYREPGTTEEAWIGLVEGQRRTDVDFVLTRGALLSVQVLADGSGAPLEGVTAQLQSLRDPVLAFLPSSRDRLEGRAGQDGTPGLSPPGGLLGVLPTRSPTPAIEEAPGGAGGDGEQRGDASLQIGPVPAGEYRLVLHPGPRNAAFLPVTWGVSSGIPRDGRLRLEPGQRIDATVELVRRATEAPGPCQQPGGPGDGRTSPVTGSPGWPGLVEGFLGPQPAWSR